MKDEGQGNTQASSTCLTGRGKRGAMTPFDKGYGKALAVPVRRSGENAKPDSNTTTTQQNNNAATRQGNTDLLARNMRGSVSPRKIFRYFG